MIMSSLPCQTLLCTLMRSRPVHFGNVGEDVQLDEVKIQSSVKTYSRWKYFLKTRK